MSMLVAALPSIALILVVGAVLLVGAARLLHPITHSHPPTLSQSYAAYCRTRGSPPDPLEIDYLLGAGDPDDLHWTTRRQLRAVRKRTYTSDLVALVGEHYTDPFDRPASRDGDRAAAGADRDVHRPGDVRSGMGPIEEYLEAHGDTMPDEPVMVPSNDHSHL